MWLYDGDMAEYYRIGYKLYRLSSRHHKGKFLWASDVRGTGSYNAIEKRFKTCSKGFQSKVLSWGAIHSATVRLSLINGKLSHSRSIAGLCWDWRFGVNMLWVRTLLLHSISFAVYSYSIGYELWCWCTTLLVTSASDYCVCWGYMYY